MLGNFPVGALIMMGAGLLGALGLAMVAVGGAVQWYRVRSEALAPKGPLRGLVSRGFELSRDGTTARGVVDSMDVTAKVFRREQSQRKDWWLVVFVRSMPKDLNLRAKPTWLPTLFTVADPNFAGVRVEPLQRHAVARLPADFRKAIGPKIASGRWAVIGGRLVAAVAGVPGPMGVGTLVNDAARWAKVLSQPESVEDALRAIATSDPVAGMRMEAAFQLLLSAEDVESLLPDLPQDEFGELIRAGAESDWDGVIRIALGPYPLALRWRAVQLVLRAADEPLHAGLTRVWQTESNGLIVLTLREIQNRKIVEARSAVAVLAVSLVTRPRTPLVATLATRALTGAGNNVEGETALLGLLGLSHPDVRIAACRALGAGCGDVGKGALAAAAEEPDPVGLEARRALTRLAK